MKVIVGVVLAAFLGLHVYAAFADGLIDGFIAHLASLNGWGLVLTADLLIALGMVAVWVAKDARKRGMSPVPYVALTLGLGSVGPLLYLLRRK